MPWLTTTAAAQMLAKENKMLADLQAQLAALEYQAEFRRRVEAQRRKQESGASLLDDVRRQVGVGTLARRPLDPLRPVKSDPPARKADARALKAPRPNRSPIDAARTKADADVPPKRS